MSTSTATPKLHVEHLTFKTDRQRLLMASMLKDMKTYIGRQQNHYVLNGMSTHHIVNHAIRDTKVLKAFWPSAFVHVDTDQRHVTYELADRVLEKTQDAMRDTLKQLVNSGYVEQMGNEHERRYRPVKSLHGQTL